MAVGLGAQISILDLNLERLRYLDDVFGSRIRTIASNAYNVRETIANADLVIGAVLIPGASAPKLVTGDMLKTMQRNAVIVDVAVDQGGCIETTHPTTHSDPTFYVDDVLHYCVANMPGCSAYFDVCAYQCDVAIGDEAGKSRVQEGNSV